MLRMEADGSARAKSGPHGEVTADVSGGVARRWNSFQAGDHPSGISTVTGQGRICPLQESFLFGAP